MAAHSSDGGKIVCQCWRYLYVVDVLGGGLGTVCRVFCVRLYGGRGVKLNMKSPAEHCTSLCTEPPALESIDASVVQCPIEANLLLC